MSNNDKKELYEVLCYLCGGLILPIGLISSSFLNIGMGMLAMLLTAFLAAYFFTKF